MPCFVDRAPPERQAEVRQSMEATLVPGKAGGRQAPGGFRVVGGMERQ